MRIRSLSLTAAAAALCLSLPSVANAQQDFSAMSWDEIVAQAQEEGEVVWYVWYFQPAYREFVQPFTEATGIEVIIPEGTHDGNFEKMLAESGREEGDIDVIALGGSRHALFDQSEYYHGPLSEILPGGDQLTYELEGVDTNGYAVAFWGNQTGLAYNPRLVDFEDLPQTLPELEAWMAENPQWFGFNYENGGAGPSFVQSMVRNLMPEIDTTDGEVTEERLASLAPVWDWFLDRSDQFVITASNADSLTRVNDGEFAVVAAWEDHLASLQAQGEVGDHIAFYIPEWGHNGGGNLNGIPLNAQHPAAALVFLDWLTSAETQTALNQRFGVAPMHPDADDSAALVPNEQRAYSRVWTAQPFGDEIRNQFIENVALEM